MLIPEDENLQSEAVADEVDEGEERLFKYFPPEVRLRRLTKNENLKNYMKQRRVEGFRKQIEKKFKFLFGIKNHIDTDEYLRKLMTLSSQEYSKDERYTRDSSEASTQASDIGEEIKEENNGYAKVGKEKLSGEEDTDKENEVKKEDEDEESEDAESYVSQMFVNDEDASYLKFLQNFKKCSNLLKPHWYFKTNVKYMMSRDKVEQYLPITVTELRQALEKFELVNPLVMYTVRNFMRPGFLAHLKLPPGASYETAQLFADVERMKKKSKFGVPTEKNRQRWKSRRRGKCSRYGKKRRVLRFRGAELNDEMMEWQRISDLMKMLAQRPCAPRSKFTRKRRRAQPPYAKGGPDFSNDLIHLQLPTVLASEADEDGECVLSDVDDEEEIPEETLPQVKKQPRTNNLLKAIFEECVDQIFKIKPDEAVSSCDDSNTSGSESSGSYW